MRYPTIEKLQSFFFRAMLSSGWIGGGDIADSTEMPGYKVVSFFDEEEELLLIDTWCSGDDGYSSGSTTIYMGRNEEQDGKPHFKWVPVWVMHYMGRYDDEAIPVVKAALREAYRDEHFVGGRGPQQFDDSNMRYINNCTGGLGSFCGEERVFLKNTSLKRSPGFHVYNGMLLFDIK